MTTDPLVAALIRLQGNESHTAFGKRLGIDGTYWSRIRDGKRNMGGFVLGMVLTVYPHLQELVNDYMQQQAKRRAVR